MDILDIHTHTISKGDNNAVYSHSAIEKNFPNGAKYISLSIHPWYLTEDNISVQLQSLKDSINKDKIVVAIGECGIDKLCDTPLPLQLYAFEEAAKIARDNSLPLIIHAVKSSNEIINIRKMIGYDSTWIIHGFRGKEELASEYLRHNINISFGEKYNCESLKRVPIRNFFIETDESKLSIDEISENIARDLGCSCKGLKKEISDNVLTYFPLIK